MSERTVSYDLTVTGSWGLYAIAPLTTKGRSWTKRHLTDAIAGAVRGSVMCESGRMCREIVAEAVKDGLRVEVNGVDMKGFRAA
ncbi:MAG: hypothetical protein ACREJC_10000 [Tepidisphaeraceae bacterium]